MKMNLKKLIFTGVSFVLVASIGFANLVYALSNQNKSNEAESDSAKVEHVISKDKESVVEAEKYDSLSGGRTLEDNAASGGAYIGDFTRGCKAIYTLDVKNAGTYEIKARVASPQSGIIKITSDKSETDSSSFKTTGGWQSYADVTLNIWLEAGVQTFTVENMNMTWNLDKLTFKFLKDTKVDVNLSKNARFSASSGDPSNLKDGNFKKGWKANGTTGEYVLVRLDSEYVVNFVKLFDIADSHITKGRLLLSDGTVISVGELSTEGTVIAINGKDVSWVKFIIDEVSGTTKQAGLSEIEVMGITKTQGSIGSDIALESFIRIDGRWEMMTDYLKGITLKGNVLEMIWAGDFKMQQVRLVGLPESLGSKLKGTLTFDDGSTVAVDTAISKNLDAIISFESKQVVGFSLKVDGLKEDSSTAFAMVQVFGNVITKEVTDDENQQVYVTNRWKNQRLIEENNRLMYAQPSDEEYMSDLAMWKFVKNKDGLYTIQNAKTNNYIVLIDNNDTVECLPDGNKTDAGLWRIEKNNGYVGLANKKYDKLALHVENQDARPGEVLASEGALNNWYSAMWELNNVMKPSDHEYTISANKIEGTTGKVFAYSDKSLISNASGIYTKWLLNEDISKYPEFVAPNNTISQAVYNLSLEETILNTHDSDMGEVFWTGANWGGVWTRDVSMSIQYSLAWLAPEISKNCIKTKIHKELKKPETSAFVQDTGTGGSYPNSVDRIILTIAGWEQYLASGDDKFLTQIYDITAQTIEQDFHVIYDKKAGLFNGETGGLDHRSKTYPDWMDETFTDSIVNITQSKSSIVNILYVAAMDILSQSADILNKGDDQIKMWKERSDTLKRTVNEKFWLKDRGMYASFIYPDFMGSPVADKVDVISNGYALIYNIASPEQEAQIMKNYPLVTYGAPTVWPQKNGRQAGVIYHNRGVWPGWEATLMIGAKEKGNLQLADEIWRSCIRGAGMSLTNKEVINYETGEGCYSDRQLWSVAGTLSGYYRVLFGMEYKLDGVHFKPYVPEWIDGPFELNSYKYRDAVLNLKLNGKGDTLTSIKVNGVEKPLDYVLPADAKGEYTIEMVVKDSGKRSEIHLEEDDSWVSCPDLPEMTLDKDGNLTWTPYRKSSYKLWDGKKYIDVTGQNSYKPTNEGYGVYSLVAISKNGVYSEMSKPVIVNKPENVITIEAEDAKYNEANFAKVFTGFTGTGYVNDYRTKSSGMTLEIEIPKGKAGEYLFSSIYNNQGNATGYDYCGIRSVYVDGRDAGTMIFPLSNHNFDKSTYVSIYLSEGKHEVKVFYDDANWYDRNMNIQRNNIGFDSFRFEFFGTERIADVSTLQKTYETAMGYKNNGSVDKLIQTVADEYNAALEEAKSVLNGDLLNTAQNVIDKATEKLLDVMNKLSFVQADKTELNKIIDNAEKVKQDLAKYMTTGEADFLKALEEAKAVANDNNIVEGDIVVATACKTLVDKMAALVLSPNKDNLKDLINQGTNVDTNLYTESSAATLKGELAKAQIVCDNRDASEQDVKVAEKALKSAIDGLKLKDVVIDKPDDNQSSDKPSVKPEDNVNTGDHGVGNLAAISLLAITTGFVCSKGKKKKQ